MSRKKTLLSKRQCEVIADFFDGVSEEQITEKHGVNKALFREWFTNKAFKAELEFRITSSRLQGQMLIAKYCAMAAAKLVQLTDSESQETARKACLDIISLPEPCVASDSEAPMAVPVPLSQAAASKILEILAGASQTNLKDPLAKNE